jgi:hypothetical protein
MSGCRAGHSASGLSALACFFSARREKQTCFPNIARSCPDHYVNRQGEQSVLKALQQTFALGFAIGRTIGFDSRDS